MEKLNEQLQNNFKAVEYLQVRYNEIQKNPFYINHGLTNQAKKDMQWTLNVIKRVLVLRYGILDKMKLETVKELKQFKQ